MFIATLLTVGVTPSHAFLDKLNDKLKKIQQGGGSPAAASPGQKGGASNAGDAFNSTCKQVLGASFKEKKLSAAPDVIAGKYFKLSADLEQRLLQGINKSHQGSFVNLRAHIPDIHDTTVRDLAEAFNANPSVAMLAQVISYAETGDGYRDGDKPSERTEAQTLLAMLLMQYPDLALDKGKAHEILRKSSLDNSGLGIALIARHHLFGDYAQKNISTFSNYIGRASSQYSVKLADQTIFFALNNLPNWQSRDQYLGLLKQSQQMTADFDRQRAAAKSSDTNKRALALMSEGKKIDELTLEALGAGPRMAEIRAKAEMLKKEGSGEANLIEVAANQSAAYKSEVTSLLAKNPQLDDQAKAKLADANKKMVENLNSLKGITVEVALKFFSGDIGGTMESGEHINRYFRDACSVGRRQVELAKQAGVPTPQLPPTALAKDL
ncbi:hypothetical protein AOB54_08530 [beta proteobacterium MWH-UniP1]